MSIQLVPTPRFLRDVASVSNEVRKRLEKSILQFIQDPSHPGLNFETLKGKKIRFSIRVGRNHRVIMRKDAPDCYIPLHVATHDVYRKL